MWNSEGTSNYGYNQGHDSPPKTYADIVRQQFSQRDKSLAQSSETSKPHRTGWDDEIYDFSGPIVDDGASELFYQGIKDIKGKTIDDILALIPKHAMGKDISLNTPVHYRQGFQYTWTDQGDSWIVCAHSPSDNANLRKDSNTALHWTVRVKCNKYYMDSSGNFHPAKVAQKDGDNADECIINDTHIPIQTPNPYLCPIKNPNESIAWGRAQLECIERHHRLSAKYQ